MVEYRGFRGLSDCSLAYKPLGDRDRRTLRTFRRYLLNGRPPLLLLLMLLLLGVSRTQSSEFGSLRSM
eukprot:COSAG01_NODE_62651_length_283_cov_1.380435_1_plen_68_part_00